MPPRRMCRCTRRCWWSSGAAPPIPMPIPMSRKSPAPLGRLRLRLGGDRLFRRHLPAGRAGLEHAARLGYRRIVVFPYFLFTGILVQRIYDATDDVASAIPASSSSRRPISTTIPLVIDTFVERVQQILAGDTAMNCQMCKYRSAVLGFEAEVGRRRRAITIMSKASRARAPFEIVNHAHHHDHDHDHDHSHDDDHTHAPYPHADHPLGPAA